MNLKMSKEAVDAMTHEQHQAIRGLLENEHNLIVTKAAPFDLPEGYLAFSSTHVPSSSVIYGGIAPDGRVST